MLSTRTRLGIAAIGAAAAAGLQELAARIYYARTSGPTRFFDEKERTAWTPAEREALVPIEWLALRRSAVYRGEGVERGDGAPVVLVHGFLTRGLYLTPLRDWLHRIGYRAGIAPLGWNADCLDVLSDRLVATLRQTSEAAGRPAHVVGHSLGGVLARAAAARARDLVASVATLASPFRGLTLHPGLRLASAAVRRKIHARRGSEVEAECLTFACGCASVRSLARPLPAELPQLAVVTRGDGLADWRYGVEPQTTRVVEVRSSHVGIVFNAAAYAALATHLSVRAARATEAS